MADSRTGAPEPWDRISSYFFSTRKPVNILVAPTADAAAASLSLTYLMKVFLFPFKVHPTGSYEEVKAFVEQAVFAQDSEREDEASPHVDDLFVLVGLGAPVVLSDYFDFTRHIVIVVDAYRPFHLDNLRREDGERLIIWGSERIHEEVDTFFRAQRMEEAMRRRRRQRRRHRHTSAATAGHASAASRRRQHRRQRREGDDGTESGAQADTELSSSLTSYSSDDEDDDSEGQEETSESDAEDVDDADLFDGDDDDAPLSQSQERVDWRSGDSEVPGYLEALYYACACAGRSSAVELYHLSVILQRFHDAILWHAAVGVCDLYMRRLIDYGTYLVEMAPLEEAVSLQQSRRRGVLRDRTEEAVNQSRCASTNSMQLRNREEEQLYLLRHSTLWDAIWYDPQVASALDLHHVEDGRPRLSQLLASRCGVSVAMAQRPWREVPHDVASEALRRVQGELQSWVNARGNVTSYRSQIRCISRKVGYSTEVSTFDVCKLFTAVLAAVPPASAFAVTSTGTDTVLSVDEVAAMARRQLVQFQRGQFWRAHAVVDMDPNEEPFRVALAEALSLQRAVADATSSLMQPGSVQSSTGLHYALPSDPSKTSPTLESFCTMQRLAVLAERLFFTLTMSRRRDRQALTMLRPLMLSCALPQPRLLAQSTSSGTGTGGSVGTGGIAAAAVNATSNAASAGAGATSSLASAATVLGDAGAQAEDKAEYAVVLTHGGNTGAGMTPLLPMYRFQQCMRDEHFNTPPQQPFVHRNAAQVQGRENTTYLTERMLLLSVKTTISRHEFEKHTGRAAENDDGDEVEASDDDDDAGDVESAVEVMD